MMTFQSAFRVGDMTHLGRIREVRIVDSSISGYSVAYWLDDMVDWVPEAQLIKSCQHVWQFSITSDTIRDDLASCERCGIAFDDSYGEL